jgi:hypothetical protein
VARTVEVTLPSHRSDELVDEVQRLPVSVAGIQLQRNGSVKPPGDVLTVEVPNQSMQPLLRLLIERGIGSEQGTSFSISEVKALVESSVSGQILTESTDVSWEEMHQVLAKESNMTVNALTLMFAAGVASAVGISTGALHLVIAAMVIAPGFEPLSRVALGAVAGGPALNRGIVDTLKGYAALILGGAIGAALLPAMGKQALGGPGTYLESETLSAYWSSIDPSSLLVSLLAGAAGAILTATNRPVLTAGVMIALALVPSAALMGAAVVAGEPALAGKALVRWLLDVALVTSMSLLVFWWKRRSVQKRGTQF